MLPHDFVEKIYELVVVHNHEIYRSLYSNIDHGTPSDNYGFIVRKFINSLSDEQKKALHEVMRQVIVDSVSSFLNIIENGNPIKKNEKLTIINGSGDVVSGELQDLFLEYDEEHRRIQT